MPRRHQRHRNRAAERNRVAEIDAIVPVERLGLDRAIGAAHSDVVAERRDQPWREFCR